jgi:hypothetical protein
MRSNRPLFQISSVMRHISAFESSVTPIAVPFPRDG